MSLNFKKFTCGALYFEFLALRARNSKSQPPEAWELKIRCFRPGTEDPDPPPLPESVSSNGDASC